MSERCAAKVSAHSAKYSMPVMKTKAMSRRRKRCTPPVHHIGGTLRGPTESFLHRRVREPLPCPDSEGRPWSPREGAAAPTHVPIPSEVPSPDAAKSDRAFRGCP